MAKYKYVYGLCDPRNPLQPIFYIGKGSGDRKVQHFRNIPKGMQGAPASEKFEIIEAIKKDGLTPSVVILSHHATDADAYKAEQDMIAKIGLENLTNKSKGGEGVTTKVTTESIDLSVQQERFCVNAASGVYPSASDCYREAYKPKKATDKTIWEKASRLMSEDKVRARIEELRAPIVKKLQYTYEGQLKKFDKAFDLAEETGNAGAMTGATDKQTKLLDLYPADKLKVDIDADALVVRIQQGRARLSADDM
tara:strand:- start:2477 stop:3232 length:756 start_codon:yes stop_codon:yes gene_type:complete